LYSSPNIIKTIEDEMGRTCSTHREKNVYWVRVRKPKGKRPVGRPRRMWEDNVKTDFREIAWGGMYCIDLSQNRDHWRALVKRVLNLRISLMF
jgi:hypothetical protein